MAKSPAVFSGVISSTRTIYLGHFPCLTDASFQISLSNLFIYIGVCSCCGIHIEIRGQL